MAKKKHAKEAGRGGGQQLPDSHGSVMNSIERTEAGRARVRAEREKREHARAERHAAEDARLHADQVTDQKAVRALCQDILEGKEGAYNIFDLELAVIVERNERGVRTSLELKARAHHLKMLSFVRSGLRVPLYIVRMNPNRVAWKAGPQARAEKALCQYLHAQPIFGDIATAARREYHQKTHPELHKKTREHKPHAKKEMEIRPFSTDALHECGFWKMPDGAILRTWDHKGVHCAKIASVPSKEHPLFGYGPFAKTADLKLTENGSIGDLLREYLREQLKPQKIAA